MGKKFRDYDDYDYDYEEEYDDRKRKRFDRRKQQRRMKYDSYESNW